jgi:type IV pilus assembly protein PilM
MLDKLKSLLQDAPPALAFEITEAGIAAARIGARAELDFLPLKPGVLTVSPVKENVLDHDRFILAVRQLAGTQAARKRRDAALILPDFSARIAVLDFDSFPKDAREQAALIRFRLKRAVPFDAESATLGYFVQHAEKGKADVLVVMAPLEIVSRYESPFRAAGMNPGLITTSALAALDLVPENGLNVLAKLSGRVLTAIVRDGARVKFVRCLELPSNDLDEIAAILLPTFVYVEDNFGRRPEMLYLCGFGPQTSEAETRFSEELEVAVEPLRSPLGIPGEHNAGLLGYLRSIARNN